MKSKITNSILLVIFFSFFITTYSQQKTYYVGHSLVNLDIPYQVAQIQDFATVSNDYRHHINIGSPLKNNWNDTLFNSNPVWSPTLMTNIEYGTNHLKELINPYDYLVLTEAVPLRNYPIDTVEKYVKKFIDLAKIGNPNIKKFLYATWEGDVLSGSVWRNRLDTLQPIWEAIADQTRLSTGRDSVFIVPGNLAMMQLYDELQAGAIGTYTNISQFFQSDGIHLKHEGNYLIACLISAVVYHTNPIGQDTIKAGPYTSTYCVRDSIARKRIQEIAMEVACNYFRTGYNGTYCNSTILKENKELELKIYPNPSNGIINLNKALPIKIMDVTGKIIYQSEKRVMKIDLSTYPKGIYFIQYISNKNTRTQKLILN